MRRLLPIVLLALAFVPAAAADGLPVLGIDDGSSGVAAPAGVSRYVTIPAPGGTLVERINRNGGRGPRPSPFPGPFPCPAAASGAPPPGPTAAPDTRSSTSATGGPPP